MRIPVNSGPPDSRASALSTAPPSCPVPLISNHILGVFVFKWWQYISWYPLTTGLNGWVVDTLCLLSVSHCGLTDLELLQLLDILGYKNHYKVTTSHWAAFRLATKQWIQEKPNGRLHFCHQSLRQAVEHKLLGIITPVRESSPYSFQNPVNCKKTNLHRILTQFFQGQSSFWRAYAELPWNLKMSGNWEELCNFLTNPKTLTIISQTTKPTFWIKLHLIHYWNVLAEAGRDTTGAYLNMVKKMITYKTYKIKERHTWTGIT
ncbi:tetratricopeptide repeat protein 41-like [Vombatus ursinus]|uniref:tetratricopeptide repeat protein 41-like n=1 Tax=Vombatus ursinus TaxID=29139 RepID=UPI000FFD7232|nr:tetratricopeptide repeat protein 41-like [Vombatus ursinus]